MFDKKLKQTQKSKSKERKQVLEFIANNAAKKDFTDWLNANYEQQFAEDADWVELQRKVQADTKIHLTALHNYAGTLTDDEDVTKLLKDIEKETAKAEEVVSELYDDANSHRLRPVIGGASILGGFLLLVLTIGLLTGSIDLAAIQDLGSLVAAIGLLYAALSVFAGILLILN